MVTNEGGQPYLYLKALARVSTNVPYDTDPMEEE